MRLTDPRLGFVLFVCLFPTSVLSMSMSFLEEGRLINGETRSDDEVESRKNRQ